MIMMKHASLAATFVLGAALFGSTASAQLLDATATVNVNATTSEDETAAGAGLDASVGADADAASEDTETESGSSVQLTVDRATLDVNTDYAVSDADFVRSAASLESYASATVRADERLESIEVADGRMDMTYRKEAKFLWLIPVSMTVDVSVSENGEVAVRYPWYAFLMQTDERRADLEARLAAEIRDINASLETSAAAEAYVTVAGSARVDASAAAGA